MYVHNIRANIRPGGKICINPYFFRAPLPACLQFQAGHYSQSTMASQEHGGYIDYEAFLSSGFNPSAFANTLVLATNNANDVPLDLATPLSRVLFDSQEIDSHIDALATKSAIPLLTHTKTQADAGGRILANLDSQMAALNGSYAQLERDVIQKHAEAEQVRHVAFRLWKCLKNGTLRHPVPSARQAASAPA